MAGESLPGQLSHAVESGVMAAPTASAAGPIGWVILGSWMAYSILKPILFKKKPSFAYEGVVLDNTSLQNIPIPVIYGYCKVAGNVIYDSGQYQLKDSDGKETGRFGRSLLVGISEGKIYKIAGVEVDGNDYMNLTNMSVADREKEILLSKGRGFYVAYLGEDPGQNEPVFSDLILDVDYKQLNSNREKAGRVGSLKHTAYVAIAMQNLASTDSSNTPRVVCWVYGREVEYWNGSEWTDDYTSISEIEARNYLRNPVYCIRDFLINSRYGVGDSSYVNSDSFQEAGELCNEILDSGELRYRLDLIVDQQRYAGDIIDEMLSICGGFSIWTQGEYKIRIGNQNEITSDTPHFDMGKIVDNSFSFQRMDIDDVYNKINVIYTDFYNADNSDCKSYLSVEDEDDISRRGETKEQEIILRGITVQEQAKRLGLLYLLHGLRCDYACQFAVEMEDGITCEVGDIVYVSHDVPGWNQKPFRIITMEETEDEKIRLTLSEYDAYIYNDSINIYDPDINYSGLLGSTNVPETLSDYSVIVNSDDLANLPSAVRRMAMQQTKNYYDKIGENYNLAWTIFTNFRGVDLKNTKRIEFKNILSYDFNGTVDEIYGTDGEYYSSDKYKIPDVDWIADYGSSFVGQYMILFSGEDDDGKEYKIKYYEKIGDDTIITFTEEIDSGVNGYWFVVSKNDIEIKLTG